MKILVTGANGYLGQGIIKKLLDDGNVVVANDFLNTNIDSRASFIKGDLFATDDPFGFFDKPECVLHLAWRNGFKHNHESHIQDLPKHVNFIDKMIKGGVKKVCVLGTMHEIGFYEGCIKENTPCNPQNFYGISKNALRMVVELLCNNSNVILQWLRGFYIVGNESFGDSIFSKISSAEKNGESIFPFTSGKNQYDFIDYDKFCCFVSAAVQQNEVNGIINICSGFPQKLSDRVECFISERKYKIKLSYGSYPDRKYDSKAVWGDNEKIETIMEHYKNK